MGRREFTDQGPGLTEGLGPGRRTVERFPTPPHLTTTLLKTDVQQFLLPSYYIRLSREKLQGIRKGQKTQLEKTEQASEADRAGRLLELSGRGFKTTVVPMLRAQTDRTHSMKSGRGDVNREMEILREKMTEIKNTRGKEECFPWADEKTGRG